MNTRRIHILGASGSGTTTLGRRLATRLGLPHHDVDDYFWRPTAVPFRERRPEQERLDLMQTMFLPRPGWVLSGSLMGWGDPVIPLLDLAIYLTAPAELRQQRVRRREALTFGADATQPGGWRHEETEWFVEWAGHYDDNSREGRSAARHAAWLATLPCPVLRLDGSKSLETLTEGVVAALAPED